MLVISLSNSANGQIGKDGAYTVVAPGDILNAYTNLSATATAGNTSITLASNNLNSGFFGGNLAPGDLLFIIQTKGVSMRGLGQDVGALDGYAGSDTVGFPANSDMGNILNYHNCGNYEFVEVASVSGSTVVNLRCALESDYTVPAVAHTGGSYNGTAAVEGEVLVVRVPRFTDLTVNAGGSITAPAWAGPVGGAVILEVENDIVLNGDIDVDAIGFRGGDDVNDNLGFGGNAFASTMPREGGRKGEGVGGFNGGYSEWGGMHGRAAMANAGGGGTEHNSGGGGGANAASIVWNNGLGNPDISTAAWAAAWNLETLISGMTSGTTAGGGGRGGYSLSQTDLNALAVAPADALWSGDNRRVIGGLGGRPLTYTAGKLFFGGGGGSGEMNDSEGGFGGSAGGLIYLRCYGGVSGTGSIEANGQDGLDAVGAAPAFGDVTGNDGAGGGGAGGTVVVEAVNTITGISINATGGNGGNQNMQIGSFGNPEAEGPGGGGGGGYIATTASTAILDISGGGNGTTNSPDMTEFIPNGATMGSSGLSASITTYGYLVEDDTICGGGTATLMATSYGSVPGGTTLIWYSDLGTTVVGVGNSFTTPVLAATTTYYFGMCPGDNLQEVNVLVSPVISIDQTGLTIANEFCGNTDGSITGIIASGGSGTLVFDWNGNSAIGTDTLNLAAGSYTLTVLDDNGCSETAGPFTVYNTGGGPTIDVSTLFVVNESCGNASGFISGLTVFGGTGTLSYDWNGNSTVNQNLFNISAGNYTLTVTDANGCTATAGPFTVSNLGAPLIDISNIVLVDENCGNADGSISGIIASGGTGALSYDWNGIGTLAADTLNLGGGSYTLTVTDANFCTATAGPFTINNTPGPVIDISGVIMLDENCGLSDGSITGITVTGSPTLIYDWSGAATVTPDLTGTASGSHTLTVTDGNACTSTVGPFTINANTGPTIDISTMLLTDESCIGNDGSITGIVTSGQGTLSYDWNGAGSLTADTASLSAGSFTLTVTDGFGCTNTSGPHTISATSGPIIDATGLVINDENCGLLDGSITGIVVSGGSGVLTYSWNSSVTPTADLTGVSGGSYTLTVTDGAGCMATAGPYVINATVGPSIDVTGLVISGENCGNVDGSITGIIVSGGTGALTYDWSGTATTTPDLTGTTSGTYTLTVTDASGCTITSGPHNITAIAAPVVTVTGTTTLCEGQSTTLTGNGATSYMWTPGGSNNAISVSPIVSTIYTVEGTTGPCSSTITVSITVDPLPQTEITGDTVICEGESTTLTASGAWTFEWSTTDVTNAITVAPVNNTLYQVIASNGCGGDTVDVNVIVNALPIVDAGLDQTILIGGAANLDGSGGIAYQWSPPAGLNCTSCEDPIASPSTTTTYYVIVTDANGCFRTDSVIITVDETSVLFIPNIFSPNGDGLNDILFVRGGGILEFTFMIFDRWGELVFETNDLITGWDGQFKGANAAQGVYAYGISGKYVDGTIIDQTGNITLVR